jgi:hypothetical protein
MFQTKVVEKIKTHILCSVTFFQKSCLLWDNVEKLVRVGQATDYSVLRRMRYACWVTKATDTLRICHNYYFCKNAPHWYAERTLSVVFMSLKFRTTNTRTVPWNTATRFEARTRSLDSSCPSVRPTVRVEQLFSLSVLLTVRRNISVR